MSESVIKSLADLPPGPALSALLYRFDPDQLTPEQAIPVLRAWSRQRAHDHARMARTLARVAALSRHACGPVVGEWAGSEIGAALTWSDSKAGRELEFAETLATLPQVAAAFDQGRIDHGKAWVFTDVLGSADLSTAQIDAICSTYVPLAPKLTAGQLRHRLMRAILAVDPEWAGRRYRRAVARRRVCGYLAADGTATISGSGLAVDQAAAACARVDALADQLQRAGCPGAIGHIRADVFVRLLDGRLTGLSTQEIIAALLADATATTTTAEPEHAHDLDLVDDPHPADSPDDTDSPQDPDGTDGPNRPSDGVCGQATPGPVHGGVPVGIEVHVGLLTLLGLDQRPGEIPGWGPVTPEVARAVVVRQHHAPWRFALLDDTGHLLLAGTTRHRPRPHTTSGEKDDVGQAEGGVVELHISATDLSRLAAEPDTHREWAPVIADLSRRYADRHRLLAALNAHPDTRLVRGALARHVHIRDRGCVAPGCRRPAAACDLDHTIAYAAGGTTTTGNVGPLCARHHALKHQGGWQLEQPTPGWFRWSSPLNKRYDTRGEPIQPPLPHPLPRPPGPERAPTTGPREVDGPTFDPKPKAPPPPKPPQPRPPTWRSSHNWPEDPNSQPPF